MSALSRANTLRLLMELLDGKEAWAELNDLVYGALLPQQPSDAAKE